MTNVHDAGEDHGTNWDEVYDATPVWSGNPNEALVDVLGCRLADLPAGRALDVGGGEGADAVLLASRGWRITALDVSAAALARGRAAAESAGIEVAERIEWVQAGLLESALSPGAFTLVSVFYPALRREQEGAIEASPTALVAPGRSIAHGGARPRRPGARQGPRLRPRPVRDARRCHAQPAERMDHREIRGHPQRHRRSGGTPSRGRRRHRPQAGDHRGQRRTGVATSRHRFGWRMGEGILGT